MFSFKFLLCIICFVGVEATKQRTSFSIFQFYALLSYIISLSLCTVQVQTSVNDANTSTIVKSKHMRQQRQKGYVWMILTKEVLTKRMIGFRLFTFTMITITMICLSQSGIGNVLGFVEQSVQVSAPKRPFFVNLNLVVPKSNTLTLLVRQKSRHRIFLQPAWLSNKNNQQSSFVDSIVTKTHQLTTLKGMNNNNNNNGIVSKQTVVFDGAEWTSLRNYFALLQEEGLYQPLQTFNPSISSSFGVSTIVTGHISKRRVIGMMKTTAMKTGVLDPNTNADESQLYSQLDGSNVYVYADSVATIPKGINDNDAISTYTHSIVPVHCALPSPLTNISVSLSSGTSDSTSSSVFPLNPTESPCTVVVLGGNDYASKVVLALIAANPNVIVHVVAQQRNKMLPVNSRIRFINPVSESFSLSIKTFDAVVDCVGNEFDNDIDNTLTEDSRFKIGGGSILQLLKDRHSCYQYVSTETKSQQIITRSGLFSGPNDQKQYLQSNLVNSFKNSNQANVYFPAPPKVGTTIEKLLNASVLFTSPIVSMTTTTTSNGFYVRGWSLKDFWEYTVWPRDSSTTNTRFGFPISNELVRRNNADEFLDDDDDDDDDDDLGSMVSAPPFRGSRFAGQDGMYDDDDDDEDDMDDGIVIRSQIAAGDTLIVGGGGGASSSGGTVQKFSGVAGLRTSIIEPQGTGLLFLSAPFCRTCRYLKPRYTKMSMRFYNQRQQKQKSASIIASTANSTFTSDTNKTAASCTHSKDEDEFLFWNSETIGVAGKELGRELNINAVPAFVLFKDGKVYGKPISISKLPSAKLTAAIQLLQSNQPWNEKIIRQAEKNEQEEIK